MILITNTMT